MENLNIIRFFLSSIFAFLGGHITNYTIIMYAQDSLNSDLLSGIGFFLCFGLSIVFGWHAGVLSDRQNPIKLMQASHVLFIFSAIVLLFCNNVVASDFSKKALLLVSAIFTGFAWSYIAPSRLAALARLVPADKLHGASVLFNLLIMIGFGVAPIMIAFTREAWQWNGVFGLVIAFFTLSSILALRLNVILKKEAVHYVIIDEIKESFRYLKGNRLVAQALLVAIITYTILGPVQVILPRFATEVLHLSHIDRGYFLGVMALALISGGLLCMTLLKKIHQGTVIFSALSCIGIAFMLLSRSQQFFTATIFLFLSGLTGGVVVSLVVAILQVNTDDWVRGRIMSMYTISSQIIPALSGLMAGFLLELIPIQQSIAIIGVLLLIMAIASLFTMDKLKAYP